MKTSPTTKKALACAAAIAAGAFAGAPRSEASDHIDGVKTAIDNAADLSDVFAFTSPKDPSKLVLVMNVHSVAYSGTAFSNAVDYTFRLRPIVDARTLTPSPDASEERTITCTFSGGIPLVTARQRATCKMNLQDGSDTVVFDTRNGNFRAGGDGWGRGTHVFAGVRSDPWFLDLAKTLKYNGTIPFAPGPGVNGLWGQNVLSIVVEVDKSRLPGTLLAVTAQTVRR